MSMYRFFVGLVVLMCWLPLMPAEPYCNVTTYGYKDGVPSSTGSRVVQDHNGFIWIATWNGLYRFDGYEFRHIRPDSDNEVIKYSSRFRDIKMGPDRKMWCRIDDNIVLFDVDTYDFHDLHSRIEDFLGEKIKIENSIRETPGGNMALNTSDGRYLTFDAHKLSESADPITALSVLAKDTPIKLKSASFFKTPLPPSFSRKDAAYSKKDERGNIWCITKDGRIMTGSQPNDTFKVISVVDAGGSAIKYSCEDDQGNVWMTSNRGIHRIALGTSPLTYITPPEPSQLRASMTDSKQRIWLSWSDSEYVNVCDGTDADTYYLNPDGNLTRTAIRFGSPIYSMASGPDGQIWLGSKPDGLFRLTPRQEGNGYTVDHFTRSSMNLTQYDDPSSQYDNYYDMTFDRRGRLWLASMGNGIEVIDNPSSKNPQIISLNEQKQYPQEANKARRLRIIGDSLIVATTTEGLLSFPMPLNPHADKITFTLHRSEPGNNHSLGNIATMDAIAGSDGRLYVATESDGLNILTTPLTTDISKKWEFSGSNTDLPAMTETTLALSEMPDGRLIVIGRRDIILIDPNDERHTEVLGNTFWNKDLVFKEVTPLLLSDGRWLIGLSEGAVTAELKDPTQDKSFPIKFTSYNIEGGPTIALSPLTDTITLKSDERTMTLTFSALCYSDTETIRYSYRIDDDKEWIGVGSMRTLTFSKLEPGTHRVSVRSTDLMGRWTDNECTITIDVKPTFLETGWAKLLYALATLCIIAGAVWIWLYMRNIKRKQREILEDYLSLLEARTSAEYESRTNKEPEPHNESQQATEPASKINVEIPEEDKILISRISDFIDRNFSDSTITVDDMATALAMSKSSLTKKMKSLMGVTPADFLKTTRLSKSKIMLKETSLSIKAIAFDCGFSDMNYFGKCFKAAFGMSPGNFRTEQTDKLKN